MAQAPLLNVDLSGFKEVTFQFDKVHARGGKLTTPAPMETLRAGNGNGTLFVKLAVTERWLAIATTGSSTAPGTMWGKTNLLHVLRSYADRACNGEVLMEDLNDDSYDPMDAVDGDVDAASSSPRGGGCGVKRRCRKNDAKRRIIDVDIPMHPPEVVAHCMEKRCIQLFIVDRRQVWLRLDDVPWAVKYLYIRNLVKGVPLVPPDSQGPCGPRSCAI
jgi:hypothetical protein